MKTLQWPLTLTGLVQGIANRDLKLENLLLDRDGHDGTRPLLKICDFGYSKVSFCQVLQQEAPPGAKIFWFYCSASFADG